MKSLGPGLAAVLLSSLITLAAAESKPAERISTPKPLTKAAGASQKFEAPATAMDPVVVTANRYPRAIGKISKSVTLLDREELEQTQSASALDILERVPGISVARSGGLGGQIVMRGTNSETPRSVLFVDGERFRGRNKLEYNLLHPSEIDHIEVVRGPASSLYGSDAINGVVQVFRRRASAQPGFRMRLPSLETNSANALRAGRAEIEAVGSGLDFLAGLNLRQADDYLSSSERIPNSDFTTASTDLALGWVPVAGQRLELSGKWAQTRSGRAGGTGGAPGVPLVWQREDPLRELFGRLAYSADDPGMGLDRFETSVYARNLESALISDNFTKIGQRVESISYVRGPLVAGARLQGNIIHATGNFVLGVEGFHENRPGSENWNRTTRYNASGVVTSVTTKQRAQGAPDSSQSNLGVFALHDWDPADWLTFSTSLRVDAFETRTQSTPAADPLLVTEYEKNPSSDEFPLTGGVGAVLRTGRNVDFTLNWARAFRVPTTGEMYTSSKQGAGFKVPNPGLLSEQAYVYEGGLRVVKGRGRFAVTVWQADYSRLLVLTPVTFQGTASLQIQNKGAAIMRGFEMETALPLSASWTLRGNTSQTWGVDLVADKALSYVPPLNGRLEAEFRPAMSRWWGSLAIRGSAAKTRIDPLVERATAAFVVADISLGFQLWRDSTWLLPSKMVLGVTNLGNSHYQLPTTFEDIRFSRSITNPLVEPGRSFNLKLSSVF